jgi:hypothetical protein
LLVVLHGGLQGIGEDAILRPRGTATRPVPDASPGGRGASAPTVGLSPPRPRRSQGGPTRAAAGLG